MPKIISTHPVTDPERLLNPTRIAQLWTKATRKSIDVETVEKLFKDFHVKRRMIGFAIDDWEGFFKWSVQNWGTLQKQYAFSWMSNPSMPHSPDFRFFATRLIHFANAYYVSRYGPYQLDRQQAAQEAELC